MEINIGNKTPTLDKMQVSFKEKIDELEAKLKNLNFAIFQAERFLSAQPSYEPTLNRYNILCHNRSETATEIRKLKEKIAR